MDKHVILGIHLTNRMKNATALQKVLGEFGCNIKTRLGLHQVDEQACSPNGLVLIEYFGDDETQVRMEAALKAIEGLQVQKMVFTH